MEIELNANVEDGAERSAQEGDNSTESDAEDTVEALDQLENDGDQFDEEFTVRSEMRTM